MADKNWLQKLKLGKIKTQFHHYTVLVDVFAEEDITDYESNVCPKGKAWMGVKVWATDTEEAGDVAFQLAQSLGFEINEIQIFNTEPEQPPTENPSAYGVNYTPYEEE